MGWKDNIGELAKAVEGLLEVARDFGYHAGSAARVGASVLQGQQEDQPYTRPEREGVPEIGSDDLVVYSTVRLRTEYKSRALFRAGVRDKEGVGGFMEAALTEFDTNLYGRQTTDGRDLAGCEFIELEIEVFGERRDVESLRRGFPLLLTLINSRGEWTVHRIDNQHTRIRLEGPHPWYLVEPPDSSYGQMQVFVDSNIERQIRVVGRLKSIHRPSRATEYLYRPHLAPKPPVEKEA